MAGGGNQTMKLAMPITVLATLAALFLSASALRAQYLYATFDPPGSTSTMVYGIDGNNVVGSYEDSSSAYHGFIFNGTTYTTLDYPGGSNTYALGISGNYVVGHYLNQLSGSVSNQQQSAAIGASNQTPVSHSFLYNGTTYTTIDPPGTYSSYALGVSGTTVIGYYYLPDNTGAIYLYNISNSTFTLLNPPGSATTTPGGISGANVVGTYTDSTDVSHGFLYNAGVYTTIDPPGSQSTQVTAVSGSNVAGFYTDANNVPHGFLYNSGAYTILSPLGSAAAYAYGLSGANAVGSYNAGDFTPHCFFNSGGNYTTVDPPTGEIAYPSGAAAANLVGYLADTSGNYHGYLATVSNALSVPSNAAAGAIICSLTPPLGGTFTYSLVSGLGGTDNGLFTISGNSLKTSAALTSTTQASYDVLVKATATNGTTYMETLAIMVNDVGPTPSTDTPTMPVWALLFLAGLIFVMASRFLPRPVSG
jgi:hypothetical protein